MEQTFEVDYEGQSEALRVLVVDDYPDNRELISFFLKRKGVHVVQAENGEEAIDVACKSHPNLILMDLSMPIMDGFEATRRLKELGETKSIPVVAFSAHCSDPIICQKAVSAGCTQCIGKPLELDRIGTLLERLAQGKMENLS